MRAANVSTVHLTRRLGSERACPPTTSSAGWNLPSAHDAPTCCAHSGSGRPHERLSRHAPALQMVRESLRVTA